MAPRVTLTLRRRRTRKTYVLKKRLENPKSIRFENIQFMVK